MHIPDSMLQGIVCPVTATIAITGLAYATHIAIRTKNPPSAARFAAITALIFALQMMNFPISGGTSGHLLGGVLASTLLGIPFGILSIALVVTIQALVFSDGGLMVLGANIVNMALVGAGVGGIIHARLQGLNHPWLPATVSLAIASWASVVLAALAVSIELDAASTIDFYTVSAAMIGTHAVIGLGEALITLLCSQLFAEAPSQRGTQMGSATPLIASIIIAFALSPFASSSPDGLEWIAEQYDFLHASAPTFVGILPDYIFPLISNEAFATAVAGLIGVLVTFVLSWFMSRLVSRQATVAS